MSRDMGADAGFDAAVQQLVKLTFEAACLRDRLAAHQRFVRRLRRYLAGGTDCYPSDLEAMMADELPKEVP